MSSILEQLRGGLIVSCQPVIGGPLDRPEITAAFALAALDGGARGLRIEGVENLKAVRAVTKAPVIGLIKQDLADSPVRITPFARQANALIEAGADIVAFDATDRVRPEPISSLIAAINTAGALAMADCSSVEDGERAAELGCELLGSTMSGYLGGPIPDGPDLELVAALSRCGRFTVAEGRYQRPAEAVQAQKNGADAVVVGSAISRPEHITSWFADALTGHAKTGER
ncbi:N-acetylmannosamine-6-phosphate 2-epimerase [Roseibium marinum]|uniref:Putative N-acetylmannosamine-6-phosphate 2-epimerase n=1 Tax=Roseibium marinum TaxID=281252 RepID=A0A2S3UK49_9HYPH|nr:N-acetylmannosamine-6-phosphate 2-epimerase [Roseibium marinum]POF27953.1 N-acylglucosamine-6-phosphate 2-epimerase [Roseibium marinum]